MTEENTKEYYPDEETSKESQSKLSKWVSEGIVLASMPIIILFISAGYEVGIFIYYDIDFSFISIEYESMFYALALIIALIFGVFRGILTRSTSLKTNKIGKYLFSKKHSFEYLLLSISGIFLLISIFLSKFHFAYFSIACLSFTYTFTSLIEYLSRQDINEKVILLVISSILLVFGLFWASAGLASSIIEDKTKYLIYESNPDLAVIRAYNDRLICAEFDRENKTVDSTYVIIDISSNSPVRLHNEKIGPLKPIKRFLRESKKEKDQTPEELIPEAKEEGE